MLRKLSLAAVCAATLFSVQPSHAMSQMQCLIQFRDIVLANLDGFYLRVQQAYDTSTPSYNQIYSYVNYLSHATCG